MRYVRRKVPGGQKWKTFLRNHAAEMSGVGACDFLQVTDLFFRPLFAFFIIELKSRRVIHVNVTRSPADSWVAQQLREATPQANAVCERFLGSVRRECLDHFLIFHERQLSQLLKAYAVYFNQARPHQGLGQRIPEPAVRTTPSPNQPNKVCAVPVLGGLHHDYQRAA